MLSKLINVPYNYVFSILTPPIFWSIKNCSCLNYSATIDLITLASVKVTESVLQQIILRESVFDFLINSTRLLRPLQIFWMNIGKPVSYNLLFVFDLM